MGSCVAPNKLRVGQTVGLFVVLINPLGSIRRYRKDKPGHVPWIVLQTNLKIARLCHVDLSLKNEREIRVTR